jgi:lipoprotein signal peptidase
MRLFLKLLFVSAVLLAGCHSDIYTKRLAKDSLKNQPSVPVVAGYLDLKYTENRGISFSLFESLGESVRKPALVTLQILSTLVLCGVILHFRKRSAMTLFPFILVLAGAFGNLFDRIRYGYVVDFIHVHVEGGFSWPIFNLADVWISLGIGILLLQIITNRDPFKQSQSSTVL